MNNLSTPMLINPMKIIDAKNNVTQVSDAHDTDQVQIVYEDDYFTPMELLQPIEQVEKKPKKDTVTNQGTEGICKNNTISDNSIIISTILDPLVSKTAVKDADYSSH